MFYKYSNLSHGLLEHSPLNTTEGCLLTQSWCPWIWFSVAWFHWMLIIILMKFCPLHTVSHCQIGNMLLTVVAIHLFKTLSVIWYIFHLHNISGVISIPIFRGTLVIILTDFYMFFFNIFSTLVIVLGIKPRTLNARSVGL